MFIVTAVRPDTIITKDTEVQTFGPFEAQDMADDFAVQMGDQLKAEWLFVSHETIDPVTTPGAAAQYLLSVVDPRPAPSIHWDSNTGYGANEPSYPADVTAPGWPSETPGKLNLSLVPEPTGPHLDLQVVIEDGENLDAVARELIGNGWATYQVLGYAEGDAWPTIRFYGTKMQLAAIEAKASGTKYTGNRTNHPGRAPTVAEIDANLEHPPASTCEHCGGPNH